MPEPDELKALILAASSELLARVDRPRPDDDVYVEVSNKHRVRLIFSDRACQALGQLLANLAPSKVKPEANSDTPATLLALVTGCLFNPFEREIVRAIGGDSLVGKEVAAKLKVKYDTTLRIVLAGLADRGVLAKGDGYRVADPRLLELVRLGGRPQTDGQLPPDPNQPLPG